MSNDYYQHQLALLPCVMAMAERGLRVDDELRQARILALTGEAEELRSKLAPIVASVQDRLQEKALLWKTKTCSSCRNGSRKRIACPSCSGAGKSTTFSFNMGSGRQVADLLYNGLRLPRRTKNGKVTVDEQALKSLLALDSTGAISTILRFVKLSTMREIYERLAPSPAGTVHTVFNIAGAYTGRFSSSEAFYWPHSTNLQNLPAQEAARDPLYAVRECLVPPPGTVFCYADLSQAEARVSAVLAEDWDLLHRWEDPTWDVHTWTARAIFKKAESELVTASERYLGKRCRHALNYGMGPTKFWRTVNDEADLTGVSVTAKQAKEIWFAYHALHPKLDSLWWNRVQRTLEAGRPMRASHCGWRCPFWPRLDSAGHPDPESVRAAVAWEPQHTVVHVLNEGMLDLFNAEADYGHRVLLQGHDSVLLGVPANRLDSVAALAKRALERPLEVNNYRFTIPAEVFVGRDNWGHLERVL